MQCIHQVVANAVKADDAGDALDAAFAATSGDVDHDIDRFGDQGSWRIHGNFEDQLFHAQQRAQARTGVDGDPALRPPILLFNTQQGRAVDVRIGARSVPVKDRYRKKSR